MSQHDANRLKVVAHLRDGKLIKGYTDIVTPETLEELLQQGPLPLPGQLPLRAAGARQAQAVDLESLKALFFVRSFEGRNQYQELKFFDAHPPVLGLWVRIKYFDGEASEGVVHNSLHYVTSPGFFLKPPDPQSNNKLIYVLKSSLVDFRVLGVRSSY
ncbi:MAG TPA: hypothetical protein VGQ71_08920 [Terriglobales bacterium]|nr:hypothetical protein [Terriglobales bacterium]